MRRRRGVDGVGLDTSMDLGSAARAIPARTALQGNLDPLALVAGGQALRRETAAILTALGGGRACSISATASCRRRRPSTSPRWWSRCVRPRVAVVLFNLGGPDRPEAIRPFLLNLFTDPAILRVPFFVRPFLARLIAAARLEPARASYAELGGRSPLLELTRAQAAALEAELTEIDAKCFIAMRYWHPLSDETAQAVRDWRPDAVVLLPLYPQYSTTTTGSSLTAWREAAARVGLVAETTVLCCYPTDAGYVAADGSLLRSAWHAAREQLDADERAAGAVLRAWPAGDRSSGRRSVPVADRADRRAACWRTGARRLDWVICYQSRATPQRWIGPSTEAEIERAAHDWRRSAGRADRVRLGSFRDAGGARHRLSRAGGAGLGVPGYFRVPAQNSDPCFITALADLVRRARAHGPGLCSHAGGRICPADRSQLPAWIHRDDRVSRRGFIRGPRRSMSLR